MRDEDEARLIRENHEERPLPLAGRFYFPNSANGRADLKTIKLAAKLHRLSFSAFVRWASLNFARKLIDEARQRAKKEAKDAKEAAKA